MGCTSSIWSTWDTLVLWTWPVTIACQQAWNSLISVIFLNIWIFFKFLFHLLTSDSVHPFSLNALAMRLFVVPDGFVILECEEPITSRPTGQVLLDYLTDSVLAHKPSILGKPAISPDSRYLVTLDKQNTGVTLVVQEILRNILIILI